MPKLKLNQKILLSSFLIFSLLIFSFFNSSPKITFAENGGEEHTITLNIIPPLQEEDNFGKLTVTYNSTSTDYDITLENFENSSSTFSFASGTAVTLEVEPIEGLHFLGWDEDGDYIIDSTSTTSTIDALVEDLAYNLVFGHQIDITATSTNGIDSFEITFSAPQGGWSEDYLGYCSPTTTEDGTYSGTCVKGAGVTIDVTPSEEDYHIIWTVNGEEVEEIEDEKSSNFDLNEDLDILVEAGYWVNFDPQGGTPTPSSQLVQKEGKVTRPTDPYKTFHYLAGWYTGLDFLTLWDFDEDTVTSDMTLYAKWNSLIGGGGGGGGGVMTTTTTLPPTTTTTQPSEQPSTVSDLQQEIQRLTVLVNNLIQQLKSLILKNIPEDFRFTRNLSYGQNLIDVKYLQILLNSDPETQVAISGPGSPSNETTYFGVLTRNAVIKFQEKYKNEILTPLGFIKGTGYVGPSTRAKLNSLLLNR